MWLPGFVFFHPIVESGCAYKLRFTATHIGTRKQYLRPMGKGATKRRTSEAFETVPSRHPLVIGHVYKEDKSQSHFNKRYFVLYDGGLLAYYRSQRDFDQDVKRYDGVPLHCKLVKLEGLHLSWPEKHQESVKHCFKLHVPDSTNHRCEFLLAFHNKKEMRIWIEHLQSQNPSLQPPARGEKLHRVPAYIKRIRLHRRRSGDSIAKLDAEWLKQAQVSAGELALSFGINLDEKKDIDLTSTSIY